MKFATEDGDKKTLQSLIQTAVYQSGATTLGRIPSGATIQRVTVAVRTAFDGTSAAFNIGISGDTDKYMPSSKITEATIAVYTYCPNVTLTADETALATLTDADGTAGDATIIVEYTL